MWASNVCSCYNADQLPRLHQERHYQPVKGGDCSPVLSTDDTTPGGLCLILGFTVQEGHWHTVTYPAKDHKDAQGIWTCGIITKQYLNKFHFIFINLYFYIICFYLLITFISVFSYFTYRLIFIYLFIYCYFSALENEGDGHAFRIAIIQSPKTEAVWEFDFRISCYYIGIEHMIK